MKKVFDEEADITQLFGANPEYYQKWNFNGHEGIDLVPKSRKLKVPIYAVEGGVVVRDTDDPLGDPPNKNYGKKVVIWNPETRRAWWYCHLDSNVLSIGQIVKEGDLVGYMGDTGNTQGAHLHLGCRLSDANGVAVNTDNGYKGFIDPLPFLKVTEAQPEVQPLDEQRAVAVMKEGFSNLKPDDELKKGNLEGMERAFVSEHSEFGTIKNKSIQLDGFISKWTQELHLPAGSNLVEIEADMAKIMPQEETIQELRAGIVDAIGQDYADDKDLLQALSLLATNRKKLEGELSAANVEISNLKSKSKVVYNRQFGNYLVKIQKVGGDKK